MSRCDCAPFRKKSVMAAARHWLITDNNPSEEKSTAWIVFAQQYCNVFRGQEEQGDGTGRKHYQIYFQLKDKKRFGFIKKCIADETLHCEVARKPQEAWAYCGKPDTRVEGGWAYSVGDCPTGAGSRTDLSSLKSAVETGGLMGAFECDFDSAIKYTRGLQVYHSLYVGRNIRNWKTTVWVFCGPPGCGKSSLAKAIASHLGLNLYVKLCSEKWFDHYDPVQHAGVLLDDFQGTMPWAQLLAIADRDQCLVEVKGGTVPWLAKHLFITSNSPAKEWYSYERGRTWEALERRIDFSWDAFNNAWADGGLLPMVQGPRCPVILGGHLELKLGYTGKGDWVVSDVEEDDGILIEDWPPSHG